MNNLFSLKRNLSDLFVVDCNNGIGCAKVRDRWTVNFRKKGDGLLALLANLPHLPLRSSGLP